MPEVKSAILGNKNPTPFDDKDHRRTVGKGQDTARYIVDPGQIHGPNNATPGNLYFPRPYITSEDGGVLFGFPAGVESFRRSGSAALGLHRVIGSKFSKGQTTQYEEGRIEMSGIFPGTTSAVKMQACLQILKMNQRNGLRLYLPGVFQNWLYVLPENWDFSHDGDDRTHSIGYTISFVIIGVGGKTEAPHGKPPALNPSRKTTPVGKGTHVFIVKSGVRTFRQIAYAVYKNANLWSRLVPLNQATVNKFMKVFPGDSTPATYELPTHRWPIGTKIHY